jgi:hypothetical protein
MNRFDLRRAFAAAFVAFAALSLAACGGHSAHSSGDSSSSSSSSSSSPSSTSTAPDLDVTGSWITYMDDIELGVTTFKMAASGALSGSLRTGSGETASVSGHLVAKEAEYTMSFHHRTFLASADFDSNGATASGTVVDADGHVHALKLNR